MTQAGVVQDTIGAALTETFAGAGVAGYLHARDLGSGATVSYRGDELVCLASVAKVPILVALVRSVDRGELSLDQRVHVAAGGRTGGPTGLSVMKHDAELSLHDIAQLMIVVSDNHATDEVLKLVSPATVTATARELGLESVLVDATIADLYRKAEARYAGKSEAEVRDLLRTDPELDPRTSPWRATPADVTALLGLIWRDEAASAAACQVARDILYAQVWPHRLSSAFGDEVRIGAKTGTLIGGIRNEAGVLEYPDGGRYAVAVFTRTDDFAFRNPAADRVIGTAARVAVDHLRGGAAG